MKKMNLISPEFQILIQAFEQYAQNIAQRDEIARLKKELGIAEKQANLPALFGTQKTMAICSERNELGDLPQEAWPQPKIERLLGSKLRRTLGASYEVVERYVIDPSNLNSQAPDVVVFKIDRYGNLTTAIAFIEVEQTNKISTVNKKVVDLCEQYEIKEAAAYDFEKKEWYLYEKGQMVKKKTGIKLLDVSLPKDWEKLPNR